MSKGRLYIVQNPLFPTLIKIGFTTKFSVEDRGLNDSNIPEAFKVLGEFECNDVKKMETLFHERFEPYRYISQLDQRGKKTEFFYITCLKKAVHWIEIFNGATDITEEVKEEIEQIAEAEEKKNKNLYDKSTVFNKRPKFNFCEMGIPIGAFLEYVSDSQIKVKVIHSRQVKFKNKVQFLSSLTARLLKAKRSRVNPKPYWKYEGRTLSVIYNETYRLSDLS